ncbi:N-acetylmuramidase domain-containing protein [Sphingomonas sp. LHG3406-1]|uniref:N-acetylmuramidase domain-containing protein n=1 Tax=Sphingomonas sp. LHG3406-1 TaxID=2804617 RepID=UPI0026297545|nr:N-acetylmuramidase domain-containing protein [Sphingomonas sp. LHG3406-1]
MNPRDLQQWLVEKGQPIAVDGDPGPQTRAALVNAFVNTCAPAVTDEDVSAIALRLGCATRQLRAVAKVESGGTAYDAQGRPMILFERHLFHRFTSGEHGLDDFSNPKGGGYNEDSWDKLARAACLNPLAAFASVSWGRFQVLGAHAGTPRYARFLDLGYSSPLELAYSTVTGEAAHYELLSRYIEAAGLRGALRSLSTNPADCRPFAKGYNGPSYANFRYHEKLADAMGSPR